MSKHVRRNLIVLVLVTCAIPALVLGIQAIRAQSKLVECNTTVRDIATQLLMNGHLIDWNAPDPIGQLIAMNKLNAGKSHCPTGTHDYQVNVAAFGKPLAQIVNPSETVILYEDPANHDGKGGSVAFADGHAQFVSAADMPRVLKEGGVP